MGIFVYVVLTYRDTWKPGLFLDRQDVSPCRCRRRGAGVVAQAVAFRLRGRALSFLAYICFEQFNDSYLYEGRGFFGLLRVRESGWEKHPYPVIDEHGRETGDVAARDQKMTRTLIHGGINHGRQITGYKNLLGMETPAMTLKKRREPITYFHERNGVAELFYKLGWSTATCAQRSKTWAACPTPACRACDVRPGERRLRHASMLGNTQSEPPFAVFGLGTGILACYAKPFQRVDFYEIDPLVKNLCVRRLHAAVG